MKVHDLPSLTRPKISDEVYKALKERIVSRQFALGERLNLIQLEQQMGISRTPLKEALNRLAVEGLVEIQPRRGTFITDPTPHEIAESFDVRRILEVYAVEMAALRITNPQLEQLRKLIRRLRSLTDVEDWDQIYQEYVPLDYDLHRLIIKIAGNNRLQEIWEQVNLHGEMARIRYGSSETELNLAQAEHEELLHAFETKDLPSLQQITSRHIDRAKRSILKDLRQYKR